MSSFLLRQINKILGREIAMETVQGFEPSRAIRSESRPFDNARGPRSPSRNRRPHGKPRTAEAHAHAHTGPKPQRDGERSGQRRRSRA